MSEDLKPIAPEAENSLEQPAVMTPEAESAPVEEVIDYSNKGLKELVDLFQELLDKGGVLIEHIVVCLQNILLIVATYGFIAPAPQIKCCVAVLQIATQALGQAVEVAVLMNGKAIIPADVVLQ